MSSPENRVAEAGSEPMAVGTSLPPDLLLLVFIHGFKGTDTTFAKFPDRLRYIVAETTPNVVVETVVFPAYETKGELNAAVERFADWLTTLTVEKEVASGMGGGAGRAKIVLCGHSMGGLVAADALIGMVTSRPDTKAPLWPKIIACIAFDTPYFGLHPFVFRNQATKAIGFAQTAHKAAVSLNSIFGKSETFTAASTSSKPVAAITAPSGDGVAAGGSSWSKWAVPVGVGVGSLLLGGAAAGAAYFQRDNIGQGYQWATDHMKYVGTLWDEEKLKKRVNELIDIEDSLGVIFRDFYTLLPAVPGTRNEESTFIVLPQAQSLLRSRFLFCQNNIADNEIDAHMGMFEPSTNNSYYALGLETAKIIREAVSTSRGVQSDEGAPANVHGTEKGKGQNA